MYNKGKILFGILVFLALVTFPIWYNVAKGKATYRPDIVKPQQGECVEPAEWMREYHMDLLREWRDDYVRQVDFVHVSSHTGAKHVQSLSNTCLDCHSNKTEFCDRCHNYTAVDPYCWECHIDSKGNK